MESAAALSVLHYSSSNASDNMPAAEQSACAGAPEGRGAAVDPPEASPAPSGTEPHVPALSAICPAASHRLRLSLERRILAVSSVRWVAPPGMPDPKQNVISALIRSRLREAGRICWCLRNASTHTPRPVPEACAHRCRARKRLPGGCRPPIVGGTCHQRCLDRVARLLYTQRTLSAGTKQTGKKERRASLPDSSCPM
jgi:hypothetical protein